jgi:methylthioribulose-1-phosphate dehydratase
LPRPLALTNEEARTQLIALGQACAARGWTPATAGNFSVRLGDGRAAITRSGADKSRLVAEDVLLLPLGEAPPRSASAEAPIHWRLYREDRSIGAVAHAHPPATTALSLLPGALEGLKLEGLELLKVLPRITTHETSVTVPVLPNTQGMAALADRLVWSPTVPALILQGHGIYAWGPDAQAAFRHMEALEYMFDLECRRRQLR